MTVKQRTKRKSIQVVVGSYCKPVFNSYGLVVGVQVIDKTRWSKTK